jgi:hypothetical protein
MRYELVDYFDVWGNEEEGWEVNNLSREGELELEDLESLTILKALIDFGFLRDTVTFKDISIERLGEIVEIYEKANCKPICSLRELTQT